MIIRKKLLGYNINNVIYELSITLSSNFYVRRNLYEV